MNEKERQNQINQELEMFMTSELYQTFKEAQQAQLDTAISTILDVPVPSLQALIQREQNIGAAKEIRARRDFFQDLQDNQQLK